MNDIEYLTLENGLRIVCEKLRSDVDYFGVAIDAGSRDEAPGFYGLAHFVEHTIFKGTQRRHAHHILNRMEAVGGELNAFTSKEETNVYAIFPRGNLSRAVELIADLVRNSVFPDRELCREREVVREEIDSYLDSPADAVFDEFEDLFFKGSQLGHNILGDTSTLPRFTSEVCRSYIEKSYTPGRMVAFYRGGMSPRRVFDIISRYFADIAPAPSTLRRIAPELTAPFVSRRDIDSHQAHCVMGARIPGLYSDQRLALGLLTNILGGPGMNSRLNIALRERRGLVYAVDANMTLLSDCGLFTVYYGCDPADADRCAELVSAELRDITEHPLSQRAFNASRKQYLGQLAVSSDNREQMALNAGRSMIYYNRVPAAAEVRQRIMSLTSEHLLEAGRHLRPELFSRLTLG